MKKEVVKINIYSILKLSIKICSVIFTIIGIFLMFFSFNDIVDNVWYKVGIIFGIGLLSFIIAFVLLIFILKNKVVWSQGNNKVSASYDDILKIGFKHKNKKQKIIVVIPVNDTFETIVESGSETNTKPLVSPNTLQGKWITKFSETYEVSINDLNKRIQKSLKETSAIIKQTYSKEEKIRGNLDSYELGSISVIDSPNNVSYYLLAISQFDKNNNAQSDRIIIRDCIDKCLEFYDKTGQANPIYIPLMGTNLSRAKLSHDKAYKLIKSCTLTQEKNITGEVNIVVYSGDKDKVSIFK